MTLNVLGARQLVIVSLALSSAAPAAAPRLRTETLRAYDEYVGTVRHSFDERVRTGRSLFDIPPAEMILVLRDANVLVEPARRDGIVGVTGGLIHHWRGAGFIPNVTLRQVMSVAQDYANYNRVYEPILASTMLEHHDDTFRVLMRIQKRSGLVSAVLDVWSVVQYQRNSDDIVYSASDSERIVEIQNAGQPDEERLPPGRDRGYLWRANTYSSFAEQDGGVFVEMENVGLSRTFPRLLGWIIGPIARRVGRGSVEDSLVELRSAVIAAQPSARAPQDHRPVRR